MTTTVWTTIVALSAIGLATSPIARPRPAIDAGIRVVAGGPPDTLVANPAASSIRWKGAGLGGRGTREGAVDLANGMFVIRHQQVTSGTFTIDMRSLDAALRNADLFDVARYPTAVFSSTGAKRVGPARWQISGDLTMQGVSRAITFPTDVEWPELGHMIATSTFALDRREWGIGSRGSRLTDDLVDDDIQISLRLDARRKQASVARR
jgi:polyisoprenoid-binding protein YceI